MRILKTIKVVKVPVLVFTTGPFARKWNNTSMLVSLSAMRKYWRKAGQCVHERGCKRSGRYATRGHADI